MPSYFELLPGRLPVPAGPTTLLERCSDCLTLAGNCAGMSSPESSPPSEEESVSSSAIGLSAVPRPCAGPPSLASDWLLLASTGSYATRFAGGGGSRPSSPARLPATWTRSWSIIGAGGGAGTAGEGEGDDARWVVAGGGGGGGCGVLFTLAQPLAGLLLGTALDLGGLGRWLLATGLPGPLPGWMPISIWISEPVLYVIRLRSARISSLVLRVRRRTPYFLRMRLCLVPKLLVSPSRRAFFSPGSGIRFAWRMRSVKVISACRSSSCRAASCSGVRCLYGSVMTPSGRVRPGVPVAGEGALLLSCESCGGGTGVDGGMGKGRLGLRSATGWGREGGIGVGLVVDGSPKSPQILFALCYGMLAGETSEEG